MSIPTAQSGRHPQGDRAKARVEGLLEAAAAVFMEKGYDAATMTEIAARAQSSIGSLYQYFPAKDLLADALLTRYATHFGEAFATVATSAADRSTDDIARAMVQSMLQLSAERAAVVALLDGKTDSNASRMALRDAARMQIKQVLMAKVPDLKAERAAATAVLILQILKAVPEFAAEGDLAATLIHEAEQMIALRIAALIP